MSERLNEYLVREAGDYLEQMTELLRTAGPVDPEELLRLSRGVRGSAQMAGAETLARVAERLEDAARAVISHSIVWSDEIRALALQTVGDLQMLLRALNRWGPDEEARVLAAVERWDDLESADGGAGPVLVDAVPEVVAIESLFHDDGGPHVLSRRGAAAPAADDVVPIEQLLLRGDAARRAARSLRPRLESLLGDRAEGRALLSELYDLLDLAATDDARAG